METKDFTLINKTLIRCLLVLVTLFGGGNFAWANLIDNGDGTFTEDFTGISKSYGSSASFSFPIGWNCKGTATSFFVGTSSSTPPVFITSPSIYIPSSNTTTYLITPALDGDFSFWMRSYSTSYESSVTAYECTYVDDEWKIGDLIKTITIAKSNPVSALAKKTVSYTGHGYIALLLSYAYIDDFTYTPYVAVGDIAAPTSLSASNSLPTSIDLSWTAGGEETTWQLSYGTTSGSLDHKSGYVTTNPYTLTGLTPNTTYYVSVRALNDVFSTWSTEISFTTAGEIAVEGVSVSPTLWEMKAGETKTLTATVSPANATYQDVNWESSNSSVATVSSSGVVTAVAPGSATITVKSSSDETKTATCEITVTAPVTPTGLKTKDLTSSYTYLTWTNGSTENKWQIIYGTTSGNLKNGENIDITTKPFLITGLSSNTTYYASIRSKLGEAYSAWSDEISFTTPKVGPACGGASNVTESFDSDWGTTSSLSIKNGWSYYNGKTNFSLSGSYKYGASGYGLSSGYNDKQYIITPELQVGSTLQFRVCRATTNTYSEGTAKLCKAIKIGNSYHIDENTLYSSIILPNGTETTMDNLQSCVITEGGYVAIKLHYAAIDDIMYQATSTVSAITDNNGYATFASSSMLDLTADNLPSGLNTYKSKVDGTTVRFTKINQAVPANTGILLEGNSNTEYKIAVADASTEVDDNDFLVNSTGYTFAATSGYTYFGMLKNRTPLTFGTFDPSTVAIPKDKAYLKVLTSSLSAESRQLTFVFDGEATGISDVRSLDNDNSCIFDLQGRRISGQPNKGIYIVGGRKVVVK